MDVNTSDTAIGGLPGLQIFTFSVASPHPAPVTFPQEFCFPSRFSLIPPKKFGAGGADSGLKPHTCPKAKIPHGYVIRVLWDLKNVKRAAEEGQSGRAGGAQSSTRSPSPAGRRPQPSASASDTAGQSPCAGVGAGDFSKQSIELRFSFLLSQGMAWGKETRHRFPGM